MKIRTAKPLIILFLALLSGVSYGFSPIKLSLQELTTRSSLIVIASISNVDLVDEQGRLVVNSDSMTDQSPYGVDDEIRFHLNVEEVLKAGANKKPTLNTTVGLGFRRLPLGYVKHEYKGVRGVFFLSERVERLMNQSISYRYTSARYLLHNIDVKGDVLIYLFCDEYGC